MKYLIATMVFIFSCSTFSAAKWDEAGCGRIEAGVGQLIGASESMRGPVSYTHLTLPTILLV